LARAALLARSYVAERAVSLAAAAVPDQQDTQQELWIDGWTASIAVAILQPFAREPEVDMLIDQSQQVILWHLIF